MKKLAYKMLKGLGINPPDVMYTVMGFRKKLLSYFDSDHDSKNLMVNIGGTRFYKRHWKVLDYRHPETRHYDFPFLDYNFDLTSGEPFPFADDSVTYFYSSHTMEHIVPHHAQHILNELYRSLKKGGAVRLTMPDYDSVWDAFQRKDWGGVVNIGGDTEYDRFRGAVALYGEAKARELFQGWPDKPTQLVPPPYSDQKVANYFIRDFAGHWVDRISLDELIKLTSTMSREEFGNKFCADISAEWKSKHPEEHSNWWNYDKLSSMLRKAGFTTVYRSEPFKSRFPDMVGVSKYWSFDHIRIDTGLYVEAVKD